MNLQGRDLACHSVTRTFHGNLDIATDCQEDVTEGIGVPLLGDERRSIGQVYSFILLGLTFSKVQSYYKVKSLSKLLTMRTFYFLTIGKSKYFDYVQFATSSFHMFINNGLNISMCVNKSNSKTEITEI